MRVDLATDFLGVPALSKTRIHCQRSLPVLRGKPLIVTPFITSHLYSFTSINNAPFAVEAWCCRHVVFISHLHGFNESSKCKLFFETVRAFQVSVGYIRKKSRPWVENTPYWWPYRRLMLFVLCSQLYPNERFIQCSGSGHSHPGFTFSVQWFVAFPIFDNIVS